MDRKTPRPTPLRLVQPTGSRRYLLLDSDSSLPSPAYPFDQQPVLHEDRSAWQSLRSPPLVHVHPRVASSKTVNHHWSDPFHSSSSYRSLTPPISPPVSSPRGRGTEHSYKRHGRTFALIPAELNGEHVFTHVAVNAQDSDNDPKEHFSRSSIRPEEDGLPEDMQDILRQLDDLATWIKTASSTRDCISDVTSAVQAARPARHPETGPQCPRRGPLLDKGKNRLPSASPPCGDCNILQDCVESSRSTDPNTSNRSEGFIYMPSCDTPEFLVGSSSSPVAYPGCGYSSHPARCSPLGLDPMLDISHQRRFLERRSAPCPPPGKASFKMLFQRSRCNTAPASRPSIPSSHTPVENVLRQGKRVRLPWLRV